MSEQSEEPSWCVCLEGVHQEGGKRISSEQINAPLMCYYILCQGCETNYQLQMIH